MGGAINTMVFGSPDTCESAGTWLDALSGKAGQASDTASQAEEDLCAGSWVGPAFQAYEDSQHGMGNGFSDIADTASDWAGALRDFADGLRTIQQKMDDILNQAHTGGLQVNGPFILAPEFTVAPPAQPPRPSMGDIHSPVAKAYEAYDHQVDVYNTQVDAFNDKVELYNDLQDQAFDQRKDESQLHNDLTQALDLSGDIDGISLSLTGVSWGKTLVSTIDGAYNDEVAKVAELEKNQDALLDFSNGRATGEGMARVDAVMATQSQQAARVKAAAQWHQFIDRIPKGVRKGLAYGPADIPRLPSGAVTALKGFSYAGTIVTATSEFYQAASGRESWGEAGLKTAKGVVEGTVASRALAASVRGAGGGPGGIIVAGLAGALGAGSVDRAFEDRTRDAEIRMKDYRPVQEQDHLGY